MSRTRLFSALLCVLLLVPPFTLSASANSAQTRWDGISPTGAIISDGDCPIVVEHELLTFDIQEFPLNYYRTEAEYLAYAPSVTAQYTFYNPADYTVTATLLFPFGNTPDYASADFTDTDKYGVAVNGTGVESVVRHSYSPYSDQFDLEEDLPLLHDGYVDDGFYSPDRTVTKYTYTVSDVDTGTYQAATAAFDWSSTEHTRLWFPGHSGLHQLDVDAMRVSTWVRRSKTVTLYAIGEPLPAPIDWTFYSDGGTETGDEIPGTMTLTETETMTFRDLALSEWAEESGVLEHDWYNAFVAAFHYYERHSNTGLVGHVHEGTSMSHCLLRWYEYEITLQPGERITNAVTAPLYPGINGNYKPPIYTYTYLLSPARTWVEFGKLEIKINTPYYITESSPDGFQKTDDGYALSLDGLPDGELEFSLCADNSPRKDIDLSYLSFYAIPLLIFAVILFLIIRKIIRTVRRRRSPL